MRRKIAFMICSIIFECFTTTRTTPPLNQKYANQYSYDQDQENGTVKQNYYRTFEDYFPAGPNTRILFSQKRDLIEVKFQNPTQLITNFWDALKERPCYLDDGKESDSVNTEILTPAQARQIRLLARRRSTPVRIRHAGVIDLMEDAALEEQAQKATEKMKAIVEELETKGNEKMDQATREAENAKKNALEEQTRKYADEIEKQQIEHERRLELAISKKEMEVREFFTEKMNAIRIKFEEKLEAEVMKTKETRAEGVTRLKEAEIRLDKAIGEHNAVITAEQKRRDDLREEIAETKRKAEKKLENVMAENKDATAAAENRVRLEEREKQKLEMMAKEAKHENDVLQKLQEAQRNNEKLLSEAQKAHAEAIKEARINADKSSLQQSEHLKQLLKEEANARNELVKLFLAQIENEAKKWAELLEKERKDALTREAANEQRHDKDRQRVLDDLMASKNRELKQVTEMFKAEIERVTSDERERSQREITRIQEESSSKVAAFENRIQQLESMKLKLEDSVKRLELALAKKEAAEKRRKLKTGKREELDSLVSPSNSASLRFGNGRKVRNESHANQKLGNPGKPISEIDRADEYDDAEVDTKFAVGYGLKDLMNQNVLEHEVKSNLDIEEWRTGVYNAIMHEESVQEIVDKFSDVLFEGAEKMADNCLNGKLSKRSSTHSRKNLGAETSSTLTSDQSSSKFVSFPQTSGSGPKSTVTNPQNVANVSESNIGPQKMIPSPKIALSHVSSPQSRTSKPKGNANGSKIDDSVVQRRVSDPITESSARSNIRGPSGVPGGSKSKAEVKLKAKRKVTVKVKSGNDVHKSDASNANVEGKDHSTILSVPSAVTDSAPSTVASVPSAVSTKISSLRLKRQAAH